MSTVTVSSKYQVVIPRDVREITEIKPGAKIDVQVQDGRIVLIPVRPMEEMRGILRGIDTTVEREPDRAL